MFIVFALFTVIHGLIHIAGFLKAFQLSNFSQITKNISKKAGAAWLVSCLLFIVSAISMLLHFEAWPVFALPAILISQVLIVGVWHDAKFGTIANIIIFCVALPAMGNFFFDRMVNLEIEALRSTSAKIENNFITENDLINLPPIVKNWLQKSGVVGSPVVNLVHLKQTGEMRTSPEGNWLPFTAEQYFNPQHPAFVWKVKMRIMPALYMIGRDKFSDGQGEMLIKLLSLFNIVNDGNNEKINSGTAQRYLGEICWFPSGALSRHIHWEQLSSTTAKATLSYKEVKVDGVFEFNGRGEVISFTTNRYFGGGPDATQEKWKITNFAFGKINEIKIPVKSTVTWQLKEGDFTWLQLEITELNYNE